MPNTFDDLICEVYCSLEKGSREIVGLIPSVNLDACASRAAIGQIVRSPVVPQSIAFTPVPGRLPPDTGDQAIGSNTMVIDKFRAVPLQWGGEEIKSLDNCIGYPNIRQRQIQEAIRTLVNEMERDIAAQWIYATGAVGPSNASGLFFDDNYRDVANVRKLLVDSGAPLDDLHLVLSTNAGAQLRGNRVYTSCDTACSDTILRQGILLDVHGMQIRESAQIVQGVTPGTGALATTDAAGYAIGATVITLDAVGTGTVIAGDSITFAGDPNRYVVVAGDTDVSDGGTITIAGGLLQAIPAAATAITIAANSGEKNMAFSRDAIVLATRAPAMPPECAINAEIVTDPMSGLSFQVSQWCQYYQVHYEIAIVWGVKTFNPRHLKLLTQ